MDKAEGSKTTENFITRSSFIKEVEDKTGYQLIILPGSELEALVAKIKNHDKEWISKNGYPDTTNLDNNSLDGWPLQEIGYSDGIILDNKIRFSGSASTCYVGIYLDQGNNLRMFHQELAFTQSESDEAIAKLGTVSWGIYTSGCSSLNDEQGIAYRNIGLKSVNKVVIEPEIAWTGIIVNPDQKTITIGFPLDEKHLRDLS